MLLIPSGEWCCLCRILLLDDFTMCDNRTVSEKSLQMTISADTAHQQQKQIELTYLGLFPVEWDGQSIINRRNPWQVKQKKDRERKKWLALIHNLTVRTCSHSVRCSCTSHSRKLPSVCVDTNSFSELKYVHWNQNNFFNETSDSFLTFYISQIPGVTSSFTPSLIYSLIHSLAHSGISWW